MSDSDTERGIYVQRIDPDQKEAYIEAHAEVPKGVTDAMAQGGVTEFELYVRDDIAICVLEATDIDEYVETITDDPSVEEWERRVAEFKRKGVDVDAPKDEQLPFMDRIWSFQPE